MFVYITVMLLALVGIYALLLKENLIKKIIGLAIFSNSIHLFLISLGYRKGGIAAIMQKANVGYFSLAAVDPLPQAMVLTSIVINLSVTAVALSLAIHTYRKFGTLDSKKIRGLNG